MAVEAGGAESVGAAELASAGPLGVADGAVVGSEGAGVAFEPGPAVGVVVAAPARGGTPVAGLAAPGALAAATAGFGGVCISINFVPSPQARVFDVSFA